MKKDENDSRALISIILDLELSDLDRTNRFKEYFDKHKPIAKTVLNELASMAIGYNEILELILSQGVDQKYTNEALNQHLYGDEETVALLLKYGADSKLVENEESLLQRAVINCSDSGLKVVELLLQYGADPNWCFGKVLRKVIDEPNLSYVSSLIYLKNPKALKTKIIEYENSNRALHYLMREDNIFDFNAQLQMVRLLRKYKAKFNLQNQFGKTPLHVLCEFSGCNDINFGLFNEMIKGNDVNPSTQNPEEYANVAIQDNEGNIPAHLLLQNFPRLFYKSKEFIQALHLLIKNKEHANIQNNEGDTPLHVVCILASKFRNDLMQFNFAINIIQIIISKGGDMQKPNKAGITPQQIYDQFNVTQNHDTLNNNNSFEPDSYKTSYQPGGL